MNFKTSEKRGAFIETENVEQAKLIKKVAEVEGLGRHEFFPVERSIAAKLFDKYSRQIDERVSLVQKLVEERTADVDLQEEIKVKVLKRF